MPGGDTRAFGYAPGEDDTGNNNLNKPDGTELFSDAPLSEMKRERERSEGRERVQECGWFVFKTLLA